MTRNEILKTARPILFNTEMVRAILDGRKTVTRRIIKPQPHSKAKLVSENLLPETFVFSDGSIISSNYDIDDYLYVRETWGMDNHNYLYRADFSAEDLVKLKKIMRWAPSIHMPKEAARIFLRVTDVRVERLQDITEEQSIAEGCNGIFSGTGETIGSGWSKIPQDEFSEIWDSTVKKSDLDKYGWEANPWVWVIKFERVEVE